MNLLLIGVLLALIAVAYQIGLSKSRNLAGKEITLRSCTLVPDITVHWLLYGVVSLLLILLVWNLVEANVLQYLILQNVPTNITANLDVAGIDVLIDRVKAIASGFGVSDTPAAYEVAAAEHLAKFEKVSELAKFAVVICAAMLGLVWAKKRVSQTYRARNQVERTINVILIYVLALQF